jgi:hypothetical protein
LWGHYYNVNPINNTLNPSINNITKTKVVAGQIWKSVATTQHYLEIPNCGAWTLLICGKPYNKWGFFVDGKKWRLKKYFSKFKHPDKEIQ